MGLCLGAFVLGDAGLLDGRQATTHCMARETFARRFPDVVFRPDVLYVEDGNIATSAGNVAAIDCCLNLVRTQHGADESNRMARISPGNLADISAAPALLDKLPPPARLLADKGYDATSFRARLAASATEAVIPSSRSRKTPIPHDADAYKARNLIERAFCQLKDWRRIATRHDKRAISFASAVAIAAIVIWWT